MSAKPPSANDDPAIDQDRPATFGDVFGNGEARALFSAFSLSTAGSMLARVAITVLVFQATDSPLIATAAFAIQYAPYLGIAQILGALADRFPYRATMVLGDLLRVVLIGLIAIPGMPVPVMLILAFAAATVAPAYQAARSAMLAQIVRGDALTVAISMNMVVSQSSQLTGYFLGGVLSAVNPRLALAINAATFAIAAIILTTMVRQRPAASSKAQRKPLLTETREGFSLVFGTRLFRIIAVAVFLLVAFTIVPEGAAVVWADHLDGGPVLQGTIMACAPLAAIVSAVVFTRFVSPSRRQRMMKPMLILAPAALVPALLDPPVGGVIAIAVACNLAGGALAALNAVFVRAVPEGYRARANSVMMSGLFLVQGAAIVIFGAMAQAGIDAPQAVGIFGVVGIAAMGSVIALWPTPQQFEDAVTEAGEAKRAADEILVRQRTADQVKDESGESGDGDTVPSTAAQQRQAGATPGNSPS